MANKSADISVFDAPIVIGLAVICALLYFVATQVSM
jgi:hypothetical protein